MVCRVGWETASAASPVEGYGNSVFDEWIDKFDGSPVGVETLAAAIGEEADIIGDGYELYLLQGGAIARTVGDRTATQRGYKHLGRRISL